MSDFKPSHLLSIGLACFIMLLLVLIGVEKPHQYEQGEAAASVSAPDHLPQWEFIWPTLTQPDPLADTPGLSPEGTLQDFADHLRTGAYDKIKGKLRAGETLATCLGRLEIAPEDRKHVMVGLQELLDLKRLEPGSEITVYRDPDGTLAGCSYRVGPLESYTLFRTAEGLSAVKDHIPLDRYTVRLGGMVETSLFNAFSDWGEESKLVYAFADIFSSQIDFNTELQRGDRVSLLVEKYYQEQTFVGYGRILIARYEPAETGRVLEAFYHEPAETPGSYYDRGGRDLGASFIRSPVPIARITSHFSLRRRHPILGVVRPHLGVDLAAPAGTPVMAAADGRVSFLGVNGGFGRQIVLEHAGGYRTHYGHLLRYQKGLKKGSLVKQKELIGYVGSSGLATGPHLDYRLEHLGEFKNPFALKFRANRELGGAELGRLQLTIATYSDLLDTGPEGRVLAVKKMTFSPDEPLPLL